MSITSTGGRSALADSKRAHSWLKLWRLLPKMTTGPQSRTSEELCSISRLRVRSLKQAFLQGCSMFGIRRDRSRPEDSAPVDEFPSSALDESTRIRGEVARHLPLIQLLSAQVKGTAEQIERAVVSVSSNFEHISEQARSEVSRTADFLSNRDCQKPGRRCVERSDSAIARDL